MKLLLSLIFVFFSLLAFAQQKKPNTTPQTNKPTTQKPAPNKNTTPTKPKPQPKPQESQEPQEYDYSYIKVDSTCPRCKGYKHDRACDGLYCYSGACSSCKGYEKCVRCAGTQMKEVGLEGCPDCSDGNCRTCKGRGICAKCEGTGKLPCTLCGGTGKKSPEQIQAERLKRIELEKRRFEERERKRLYGF